MQKLSFKAGQLLSAIIAVLLLFGGCATSPAKNKEVTLNDLVIQGDFEGIRKFYSNQEELNKPSNKEPYVGLYPLHIAVTQGNTQIAEILIVLGAKPDNQDLSGKTALRYAVDRKQTAMVKMLIDRGADPFVPDVGGTSPAQLALHSDISLLDAMFNSRNINNTGPDGRTILHHAADALLPKEVDLLLSKGALVQIKDKADRTALDLALLYPEKLEAAQIAEKLILKGANPSFPEFSWFADTVRRPDYSAARFANGNTPLHEAISRYQYGFALFLLLNNVDPNLKNLNGDAPLHLAVKSGYVEGARLLLSHNANPDILDANQSTPLHLTIPATQRLEMVKLLLAFKANPAIMDNQGNTPLHKAVTQLYAPEIVETLIQAGAPVNAQNSKGDTPLIICARTEHYEYARPLIEAKAEIFKMNQAGENALKIALSKGYTAVDNIVLPSNVNQSDDNSNSVLMTAVLLKANPDVLKLILSKGADPNAKNKAQDTALHIAVRQNYAQQGIVLLDANADVFQYNAMQENPLFLALTAKPAPLEWFFRPNVISATDANGDSVVHHAARKNLPDGIAYLIKKGANIEALNNAGEIPLHTAAKYDSTDAIRYLVSAGSSLNAANKNGDIPLQSAVLNGAFKATQMLLAAGSPVNNQNYSGETALHQASKNNSAAIIQLLIAQGANTEIQDSRGFTPLITAAANDRYDAASELIKAKALIDTRDYLGSTPLYHAVSGEYASLIRLFLVNDADIHALNAQELSPFRLSLSKNPQITSEFYTNKLINKPDSNGDCILHIIVKSGQGQEALTEALKHGANLNARNSKGDTPLMLALKKGDLNTAVVLIQAGSSLFISNADNTLPLYVIFGMDSGARMKLFSAAGTNSADFIGESLLHYAVRANNADIVSELLSLGADRNAQNRKGETPKDIAQTKGYQEILAILARK
ncbi:MAG TPA: ankyrin repeat domain-containing protein [Rectinema sp.]|jgi:ankyrin repeat protein|nr:ankyrin repeat domain-containing protein [Rectinema sp.]